MRSVHVITPGDHFSPSTGSAIPTVVDGLCRFQPEGLERPAVAVAHGTYANRYHSADILEYEQARPLRLPALLAEKRLEVALGMSGLPRWPARRRLQATMVDQGTWAPAVVFAHNAPQLVPLVDTRRHTAVVYAHNQLLRTYREGECARTLGSMSAYICVSDSLANATAHRLPATLRGLVRVVRNGVDYQAFSRGAPLTREGPLRVVFVGRMIPDKGADVLVEAVRQLDRDDIHLTLIGSSGFDPNGALTKYERTVRELASELGPRAKVRPFIPRREVAEVLRRADVVVVPSRWPEPFALTAPEGMAAGAAVVGSDIGGIPEAMGGAGILVEPDNSTALAGVLEALVEDDSLLSRTAEACDSYAREHDWAWASAALVKALEEVA